MPFPVHETDDLRDLPEPPKSEAPLRPMKILMASHYFASHNDLYKDPRSRAGRRIPHCHCAESLSLSSRSDRHDVSARVRGPRPTLSSVPASGGNGAELRNRMGLCGAGTENTARKSEAPSRRHARAWWRKGKRKLSALAVSTFPADLRSVSEERFPRKWNTMTVSSHAQCGREQYDRTYRSFGDIQRRGSRLRRVR